MISKTLFHLDSEKKKEVLEELIKRLEGLKKQI